MPPVTVVVVVAVVVATPLAPTGVTVTVIGLWVRTPVAAKAAQALAAAAATAAVQQLEAAVVAADWVRAGVVSHTHSCFLRCQ